MLPRHVLVGTMHWRMGNLPEATHSYKNNSPLSASHLPVPPQSGMVPREYFNYAGILTGLILYTSFTANSEHCELVGVTAESSISRPLPSSSSSIPFYLLLLSVPQDSVVAASSGSRGKACDTNIPLRTEHSISYSQNADSHAPPQQLLPCAQTSFFDRSWEPRPEFNHIHWKPTWQCYIWQINLLDFYPRFCDLPSHGLLNWVMYQGKTFSSVEHASDLIRTLLLRFFVLFCFLPVFNLMTYLSPFLCYL